MATARAEEATSRALLTAEAAAMCAPPSETAVNTSVVGAAAEASAAVKMPGHEPRAPVWRHTARSSWRGVSVSALIAPLGVPLEPEH